MVNKIPSRFYHPYYVMNLGITSCYFFLRYKHLDPGELGAVDPFGFTREGQIYISLLLMVFVRWLSAPTVDAYLASCFMFARTAVVLCLWFMSRKLCAFFILLWVLVFVVFPQPRYKHPSSILVLNNVTFDQRITNNTSRTINVIWFYTTWSPHCTQLSPVLADLAKKFHHPRLRFSKVDVSRWPQIAERYDISLVASSQQLPTVVCFRQGVEVSRLPSLDDVRARPSKWKRGFTAAHVAEELMLDNHFRQAEAWEADARRRHDLEKSSRKSD